MESALDDIIGGLQELEDNLDLPAVNDCIDRLEQLIASAASDKEESEQTEESEDLDDDEDEAS
jgi:hypothetical protein